MLKNLGFNYLGQDSHKYGWRWVVIPRNWRDGELNYDKAYQSTVVNSEGEPYSSMIAAMDACLNFYVREFHSDD